MVKVVLLHLDLGIGGAEQLVVNVASAMQRITLPTTLSSSSSGGGGDKGEAIDVRILTSHHDVNHCFEETKPTGNLGARIRVHGDWLPRQIFGYFTALCGYLRMLYLAFTLILFYRDQCDIVFIDGISAPIALLRMFGFYVIYYCHFPDQLLVQQQQRPAVVTALKACYRGLINAMEETTTKAANKILVNSNFTATIFQQTFPSISAKPRILYPVIQQLPLEELSSIPMQRVLPYCDGATYDAIFVSLNRYERKKCIELAIHSLMHFQQLQRAAAGTPALGMRKVLLVVAGGYDSRVSENVEYYQELNDLCKRLGLRHGYYEPLRDDGAVQWQTTAAPTASVEVEVIFRVSISSQERSALMLSAAGLLYTPDREHFGIVPLEAMYLGTPVIAVNTGGPTETIVDGETGFLCAQTAEEFGERMNILFESWQKQKQSKDAGDFFRSPATPYSRSAHQHIQEHFTVKKLEDELRDIITNACVQIRHGKGSAN